MVTTLDNLSTSEDIETNAIKERVKKIVVEQLGVDESRVTEDASFRDDLGADSLDNVELVMALEEAFDMEMPDNDTAKIKTIQDAIKYIKDNLKKNTKQNETNA